MSRLCLDSSAYVQFSRGDDQVVDMIDAAGWLGVPVVVIGELLAGFKRGSKAAENGRELDRFLACPFVAILPTDGDVAAIYADIVDDLRRAGRPMPPNDSWIAAAAVRSGATVVTYDAHFASIRRVGSIVLTPAP